MKSYLNQYGPRILIGLGLALLGVFGVIDPAAAALGGVFLGDVSLEMKAIEKAVKETFDTLQGSLHQTQDLAQKAMTEVEKYGTLHGETNKKLGEVIASSKTMQDELTGQKDQIRDLLQKIDKKYEEERKDLEASKTVGELMIESAEFKQMMAIKGKNSSPVKVSRKSLELGLKAIINASPSMVQPLVPGDRIGLITPAQRRLTIRDMLPQLRTTSNLLAYTTELVFSNAAAPQGGTASPTAESEGQPKAMSEITFQLSTQQVITVAHWVAASRQILDDAVGLQDYINSRLGYGLKLEEERELLNGAAANGELVGLRNAATAYTGSTSNDTRIDTLLRALTQVALSEFSATGFILHPMDWMYIQLQKDTTGRYLFSDPHTMQAPRIWALPVVATQSMALGSFLCGAFDMGGAIYDREEMTVRISDQHQDFFTRNLIAILCEERLALVVYRPTAFVTGTLAVLS